MAITMEKLMHTIASHPIALQEVAEMDHWLAQIEAEGLGHL
jgi:hypothetical protein